MDIDNKEMKNISTISGPSVCHSSSAKTNSGHEEVLFLVHHPIYR